MNMGPRLDRMRSSLEWSETIIYCAAASARAITPAIASSAHWHWPQSFDAGVSRHICALASSMCRSHPMPGSRQLDTYSTNAWTTAGDMRSSVASDLSLVQSPTAYGFAVAIDRRQLRPTQVFNRAANGDLSRTDASGLTFVVRHYPATPEAINEKQPFITPTVVLAYEGRVEQSRGHCLCARSAPTDAAT
jgi:hypothetical protein